MPRPVSCERRRRGGDERKGQGPSRTHRLGPLSRVGECRLPGNPQSICFPFIELLMPRPEGQAGKAPCDTTRHSLFLSQLTSCTKQRASGGAGNEPVNAMPNPMVAGAPRVGGLISGQFIVTLTTCGTWPLQSYFLMVSAAGRSRGARSAVE